MQANQTEPDSTNPRVSTAIAISDDIPALEEDFAPPSPSAYTINMYIYKLPTAYILRFLNHNGPIAAEREHWLPLIQTPCYSCRCCLRLSPSFLLWGLLCQEIRRDKSPSCYWSSCLAIKPSSWRGLERPTGAVWGKQRRWPERAIQRGCKQP